jgi:hypothetical protein
MPRYFFDINDGHERTVDTEGQQIAGFEAARRLAVQELAHLIRDDMPDGERESYVVTVRDESGRPVYVATASMIGEMLTAPPTPAGD